MKGVVLDEKSDIYHLKISIVELPPVYIGQVAQANRLETHSLQSDSGTYGMKLLLLRTIVEILQIIRLPMGLYRPVANRFIGTNAKCEKHVLDHEDCLLHPEFHRLRKR